MPGMRIAGLAMVFFDILIGALPVPAQPTATAPPPVQPSPVSQPATPPATSTAAPGDISHEEAVKEQERRDREVEAERDRDDQG